ncbi:MAG TPA: hypothetical protein VL588_12450 [Bdellovibrionota bacterium]|nr:hypothetical protein [Bdellovibrionota bacterium]
MSGGWGDYYIVFLAGLIGLLFPAILGFLSWLLSPADVRSKYLAGVSFRKAERVIGGDGRRINTRFFLGINIATLLLVLTLLFLPAAAAFRGLVSETGGNHRNLAVVMLVSVVGFLALSLFYAVRKRDLSWLRSYRAADGSDSNGGGP